jgi:pyridoxal phosphate enzyme (YggS family)
VSLIASNMRRILAVVPDGVHVVVVAKGRQQAEIIEAVEAGATIIGENYVQEAEQAQERVGLRVQWHFVGHLQSNKAKKAVSIFDLIQTVDSVSLAREINRRASDRGGQVPVLLEVNSGREPAKSGLVAEEVESALSEISTLPHLKVAGLMTMGPALSDPEELRPYFRETRKLFERLCRCQLPGVEMTHLSMGMSDSFRIAIDEGANMVRLGRAIFGERE